MPPLTTAMAAGATPALTQSLGGLVGGPPRPRGGGADPCACPRDVNTLLAGRLRPRKTAGVRQSFRAKCGYSEPARHHPNGLRASRDRTPRAGLDRTER